VTSDVIKTFFQDQDLNFKTKTKTKPSVQDQDQDLASEDQDLSQDNHLFVTYTVLEADRKADTTGQWGNVPMKFPCQKIRESYVRQKMICTGARLAQQD